MEVPEKDTAAVQLRCRLQAAPKLLQVVSSVEHLRSSILMRRTAVRKEFRRLQLVTVTSGGLPPIWHLHRMLRSELPPDTSAF